MEFNHLTLKVEKSRELFDFDKSELIPIEISDEYDNYTAFHINEIIVECLRNNGILKK